MGERAIRNLRFSLVAAMFATVFTPVPAQAQIAYVNKGTAELYNIVEAGFVADDALVAVLANDSSNAVIQLVNPITRVVTRTLEFTPSNTDGSNTWQTATDMALSPDRETAYITFTGTSDVVAKVSLTDFSVTDYLYFTGLNSLGSGGHADFVALTNNGATVWVHATGSGNSVAYTTSDLSTRTATTSGSPEVGVTTRSFSFDATSSSIHFADQTDGQGAGEARSLLLRNSTIYANTFDLNALATAIDSNATLSQLFVGSSNGSSSYLFRGDTTDPNADIEEKLQLDSSFSGVRQIAASADGSQLVTLSDNGVIARMPLGRGWLTTLVDYSPLADLSVTLGSNRTIAVATDGSMVTYLDSRTGANDNIINFSLHNVSATTPLPVSILDAYPLSKKKGYLFWEAPLDNGGSPITKYLIQCTNGSSKKFKTVKQLDPDVESVVVKRPSAKKSKCRVSSQNAIGTSATGPAIVIVGMGRRWNYTPS